MSMIRVSTATASDLVERYRLVSEAASQHPVVITEDGHPRNVLLSIEEYERLKRRDQHAFMAADTPDRFLSEIEASARGATD